MWITHGPWKWQKTMQVEKKQNELTLSTICCETFSEKRHLLWLIVPVATWLRMYSQNHYHGSYFRSSLISFVLAFKHVLDASGGRGALKFCRTLSQVLFRQHYSEQGSYSAKWNLRIPQVYFLLIQNNLGSPSKMETCLMSIFLSFYWLAIRLQFTCFIRGIIRAVSSKNSW